MKIAMITPGFLPVPAVQGGAVEVLIQYLIEGNEKEKNHSIDLYTVPHSSINKHAYKFTNLIDVSPSLLLKIKNTIVNELYLLFRIKKWRTSYCRKLIKQIKNKKYDLVIIHNNLMAYRDIYEKTNNKDNLIYVIHNDVIDGDEKHRKIAELISKTAKKIIAVSEHSKNNLQKEFYTDRIEVLYNCIDFELYKKEYSQKEISEMRTKLDFEEDDYIFVYSGRVDVFKGVLELIKAFKKIDYSNAKLLIVGKSWFDDKNNLNDYMCKVKQEALDIKDKVIFTGFIDPINMPKVYQLSNCLVIPSIWEEPFGVVALEGMASKLPLVITNSGGLMEFVNNQCAYIVEKNDNIIDNLSNALQQMIADKETAIKMGKVGYQRVTQSEVFNKKNYYKLFCERIGI